MWTGDRAETIAGIEDGLPAEYRHDLHDRRHEDDNPAGSILMGLNNGWAQRLMAEVGRDACARSPPPPSRRSTTRRATRWPSSSARVTDRRGPRLAPGRRRPDPARCAARSPTARPPSCSAGPAVAAPASAPRIIGSVARSGNGSLDYHDRLTQAAEAAWEAFGFGPDDVDLVELHDATAAEELYALESLGFFAPGEAGPATEAGAHRRRLPRPGRQPERRPGRPRPPPRRHRAWPRWSSWPRSSAAGPAPARWPGPGSGVAVNTGGIIYGDAGFVGIHAVRAGSAA